MTPQALSLRALKEAPSVDIEEVTIRAARIVSGRTGIVSSVELVEAAVCAPTVHWARAWQADTTPIFGVRARNDGNASALDAEVAVVKAVGESIERYCAAFWDPDALVLATHEQLGERAIKPQDWALFTEEQVRKPGFPVSPFTTQTPIRWSPGFSLTRDVPALVPASFVHIPYSPLEGEARIIPWQVSTGLACHTGLARASLKSLLEVIERDAFMLFWHRGIQCPEIDVSTLRKGRLAELVERTVVPGYRCSIRLLTLDIPIPVILVALSSREHKPFVVMGCAADCDPETALRLALEEALLSLHGIATIAESDPEYRPKGERYSDIDDLLRHAWVYAVDPALREVMRAQLEPHGRIPFESLPRGHRGSTLEQLRWLVGRLADRRFEAVVVDLTTPDIDDVGFKVVRGIIPGMQPLDVDHRHRHLGGARLYQTPQSLEVDDARVKAELNPYPHPFP